MLLLEKFALPLLGFLMLLITAAVELRLRKLVDARAKEMEERILSLLLARADARLDQSLDKIGEDQERYWKEVRLEVNQAAEDLRRQLQAPIGTIGLDAMKIEGRLTELETKTDVFWSVFTRHAANLLRQAGEDDR